MAAAVIVKNRETGKTKLFCIAHNPEHAVGIVKHLNHLNEESARITGKAIKFVYRVMGKM